MTGRSFTTCENIFSIFEVTLCAMLYALCDLLSIQTEKRLERLHGGLLRLHWNHTFNFYFVVC